MIAEFKGKMPMIHGTAYVADSAEIIGDVSIGKDSSVWPGAVLRGDAHSIRIGDNTSIQDNSVVHGTIGKFSATIGSNVTVGHNAIIHGCRIGDNCIIGMGAIILDGAEIGDWCIIGAGAVVTEGTKIPNGSLVVGVPARILKKIDDSYREKITENWKGYVRLKDCYKAPCSPRQSLCRMGT